MQALSVVSIVFIPATFLSSLCVAFSFLPSPLYLSSFRPLTHVTSQLWHELCVSSSLALLPPCRVARRRAPSLTRLLSSCSYTHSQPAASSTNSTRASAASGASPSPSRVRPSFCPAREALTLPDRPSRALSRPLAVATTVLFGWGYLAEILNRFRRDFLRMWHRIVRPRSLARLPSLSRSALTGLNVVPCSKSRGAARSRTRSSERGHLLGRGSLARTRPRRAAVPRPRAWSPAKKRGVPLRAGFGSRHQLTAGLRLRPLSSFGATRSRQQN